MPWGKSLPGCLSWLDWENSHKYCYDAFKKRATKKLSQYRVLRWYWSCAFTVTDFIYSMQRWSLLFASSQTWSCLFHSVSLELILHFWKQSPFVCAMVCHFLVCVFTVFSASATYRNIYIFFTQRETKRQQTIISAAYKHSVTTTRS